MVFFLLYFFPDTGGIQNGNNDEEQGDGGQHVQQSGRGFLLVGCLLNKRVLKVIYVSYFYFSLYLHSGTRFNR